MRARLVPALAALAVLAAGCSGGGDGEASPTLPPITEAPSESPSAAAVPSEATAATPEGAAAFVRFFYAQVEKAYRSKDPELVSALALPGCSACERFETSISSLRDEGQRTEGLIYDIVTSVAPPIDGDAARVDVVYNGPEVVRYDAAGNVVNREPAAEFVNEQVDLRMVDGSWRVVEVTRT